jgi:hypothetical protein
MGLFSVRAFGSFTECFPENQTLIEKARESLILDHIVSASGLITDREEIEKL